MRNLLYDLGKEYCRARDMTLNLGVPYIEEDRGSGKSRILDEIYKIKFTEEQKTVIKGFFINAVDMAVRNLFSEMKKNKDKHSIRFRYEDGASCNIMQDNVDICEKLEKFIEKFSEYNTSEKFFETGEYKKVLGPYVDEWFLRSKYCTISKELIDLIMKSSDRARFRFLKHVVAESKEIWLRTTEDKKGFLLDKTPDGEKVLMLWPTREFAEAYFEDQPEKCVQLKAVDFADFFKECNYQIEGNNLKIMFLPGKEGTGVIYNSRINDEVLTSFGYCVELISSCFDIEDWLEEVRDSFLEIEARVAIFKVKVAYREKLWMLKEEDLVAVWPLKQFAEITLEDQPESLSNLKIVGIYDFLDQYLDYIKKNNLKLMVFPGVEMDGQLFEPDEFKNMMKDELNYYRDWECWNKGEVSKVV